MWPYYEIKNKIIRLIRYYKRKLLGANYDVYIISIEYLNRKNSTHHKYKWHKPSIEVIHTDPPFISLKSIKEYEWLHLSTIDGWSLCANLGHYAMATISILNPNADLSNYYRAFNIRLISASKHVQNEIPNRKSKRTAN